MTQITREKEPQNPQLERFLDICQQLLSLGFIAVVIAVTWNTFACDTEIARVARETACLGQGKDCEAVWLKWRRLPWEHTLDLSTTGGVIVIGCSRAYFLVGKWDCRTKTGLIDYHSTSNSGEFPERKRRVIVIPITPPSAKPTPSASAGP